jgi:hypothetical protein
MDGFDVHAADFKGEVAENRDLARRRELPEPRRLGVANSRRMQSTQHLGR